MWTMEKLVSVKEGSEILFMREIDGIVRSLRYDFKDGQFYSEQKNGKYKPVIQLGRFFSGIGKEELINSFEDGAYKDFVSTVLNAARWNDHSSVGKKLSKLKEMLHLEGYFLEGISISQPQASKANYSRYSGDEPYNGIVHPVNFYQKEVRLFMKESGFQFGKNWENAYDFGSYQYTENNEQKKIYYKDLIVNLVTHVRHNYFMDLEVYKWLEEMITIGTSGYYVKSFTSDSFNKFIELSRKYGLEYKRLFDYLVEVDRREALNFKDAVSYLKDYISMNVDMNNVRASRYPDNLTMRHNITARNYKVNIDEVARNKFKNIMKNYSLEWMEKNWAVVTPISPDEIKEEGQKLHHCVAQYIQKVNNETCVILFLRNFNEGAEPLVTIEYNHHQNKLVQVRGDNNRPPTEEEVEVLLKFAKAKRIFYKDYDPTEDIKKDKQKEEKELDKIQVAVV